MQSALRKLDKTNTLDALDIGLQAFNGDGKEEKSRNLKQNQILPHAGMQKITF